MNAKFIFYASRFGDIVVSLDESKKSKYILMKELNEIF